jgi:hypothetical protein
MQPATPESIPSFRNSADNVIPSPLTKLHLRKQINCLRMSVYRVALLALCFSALVQPVVQICLTHV